MLIFIKNIFSKLVFFAIIVMVVVSIDPANQYIEQMENNNLLSNENYAHKTVEIMPIEIPKASGIDVRSGSSAIIDLSNINSGYTMVKYLGTSSKVKITIEHESDNIFNYDHLLTDDFEVFPLVFDNGNYVLTVNENIGGISYTVVETVYFNVELLNEYVPFLNPHQYINYEETSEVVAVSNFITQHATNDIEAIEDIFGYVISNIEYDYDKAANSEFLYIPNLDEITTLKKGICLDYAALTVAMLRCKGIPAKLVVGYADNVYHAWVSVYTNETGIVNGNVNFNGNGWVVLDPTLAATGDVLPGFMGLDINSITYTEEYVM